MGLTCDWVLALEVAWLLPSSEYELAKLFC